MEHLKIKALLQGSMLNQTVCVKGWVRTRRGSKNVSFIAINDGSTIHNIQAVAESELFDETILKDITTGCCIAVEGKLVESQEAVNGMKLRLMLLLF